MGRMMPLECPFCEGVIDWGDFGDEGAKPTCACTCTCDTERTYGDEPMVTITFHEECPFHGPAAQPHLWGREPEA